MISCNFAEAFAPDFLYFWGLKQIKMKNWIIGFCLCLIFVGCDETEIISPTGRMEVTEIQLPALPEGYFYEGWLLLDGSYISVGRIDNDSIAQNQARFTNIDQSDLNNAQSFAITVERSTGAPSDYVLLTGNFEGNTALLNVYSDNFNGILSLADRISGKFTVQNASVPSEDEYLYGVNGIWFFAGEGDEKQPTLQLDYRELSYQAWVVKRHDNIDWNMNVGVIQSDTLADNWKSFIPAPYVPNIPNFPGEDFLQQPGSGTSYPDGFFPANIRGSKVVITPIFSAYTNSNEPFPIRLLEGEIPADAVKNPNQTYELHVNENYTVKAVKLD